MGKFKIVGTCITRAKESGRTRCSGEVCNILQWPEHAFHDGNQYDSTSTSCALVWLIRDVFVFFNFELSHWIGFELGSVIFFFLFVYAFFFRSL